jgi:hypothetical protein
LSPAHRSSGRHVRHASQKVPVIILVTFDPVTGRPFITHHHHAPALTAPGLVGIAFKAHAIDQAPFLSGDPAADAPAVDLSFELTNLRQQLAQLIVPITAVKRHGD